MALWVCSGWRRPRWSEGCDPFPLLGAGEAAPGVLRPVVVPHVPERCGRTGGSLTEGCQGSEGLELVLFFLEKEGTLPTSVNT